MRVPTLLTPLKYVFIRHGTRVSYNLLTPALGSLIITVLIVIWPGKVVILGEKGYLSQIQNLMTVLGGFFVAALTLITTNQNPVLLGPVGGRNPPRLLNENKPLSRRRFLAYLFGYLAFSSFGLVTVSIFGNMIASAALNLVKVGARWWIELILMSVYNFWLSHIAVATLLGLFYFTERLQVADAVVRAKNPGAKPTPAE